MPTETRKATPAGEPEQRILETESGDDTYRYTVEIREHPDGEDDEGLAVVTARRRYDSSGGEDLEPKATDSIREHLSEQGYRVETAD